MDQWVGQWVGSGQMTNLIKLYIMILFEDLIDVKTSNK